MSRSDASESGGGGAAPYRRHQQVASAVGSDGGDRDDDEGRKKQSSRKWRRWLVRQRTAAAANRHRCFFCCLILASLIVAAVVASVLLVQRQRQPQQRGNQRRPSTEPRQHGNGAMHLVGRLLFGWEDVDEAHASAIMMPILIHSFASSQPIRHGYGDDERPRPLVAPPPPWRGDGDRGENSTSATTTPAERGDDVDIIDRGKFWDSRIGPIPIPPPGSRSPSDRIHRPTGHRIRHEYEEGELYRNIQRGGDAARFSNGTVDRATTKGMAGGDSRYRPRFVKAYVAFDDDEVRAEAMAPRVEHRRCRRTAWHRTHHPSCNFAHEIDFIVDPGVFVSFGAYREVWSVGQGDEEIIAKLNSWDRGSFSHDIYEMIRMDAMVMDLLSASPRIVDVYGHCASTVLVEPMWFEVEDEVIHENGYATTPDRLEVIHNRTDVIPQNNYTATEKLELALDMARCIADVHGYSGGVIVHDDVQIGQFLWDGDGRLTLGDFNRAEVMLWDPEEEQYCKHFNGPGFGNFRSPEEYKPAQLDEKIDVFSYGNMIYCLLTGLWPFYQVEDDDAVHKLLIGGKLPFVDERYRTRSYAEGKLVEAMERCWRFDPDERADIFEIADFLELAAAENARMTTEKESHGAPG